MAHDKSAVERVSWNKILAKSLGVEASHIITKRVAYPKSDGGDFYAMNPEFRSSTLTEEVTQSHRHDGMNGFFNERAGA